MYARYRCDGCGEMHGIEGIETRDLHKAYMSFMRYPPHPFDKDTWAIILTAEYKRRTGSTPGGAPTSGKS